MSRQSSRSVVAALAIASTPAWGQQCAPEVVDRVQLERYQAEGCSAVIIGDYLYAGVRPHPPGGASALYVFDISTPASPVLTRSLPIGGVIAVEGSLAVVAEPQGFRTVDVSDPQDPRVLGGEFAFPLWFYDVTLAGKHAFVAAGSNGLVVYDVADPAVPRRVAVAGMPGFSRAIAVEGHVACVVVQGEAVRLLDVSDPAAPTEVGVIVTPALDVAIHDGFAYVATAGSGMVVFDITDPAAPHRVGQFDALSGVGAIHLRPPVAWMIAGEVIPDVNFMAVDIGDPANPRELGRTTFPGPTSGTRAMAVHSNTAYVLVNYTLRSVFDGFEVWLETLDVSFCTPCPADCDASGDLDFFDFLCFQQLFAAGSAAADCDGSGELEFLDFLCFQDQFAAGCR